MPESEDTSVPRPRIRPRSRELKKTGLAKLRSCKCFDEVDRRLRLGWGSPELAKFIRDENDECKDISEAYVRKLVDQHRKSIPPIELSLTSSNTVVIQNAAKKMSNGINELAELEKLYNIQFKRIELGVTNEESIGMIIPATGREVFYAMKILKQSADLKSELGLTKKHLGTVELTGHRAAEIGDRYGNEGIGSVVSDPDSRRKLLSLTNRLLGLGSESMDAVFAGIGVAPKGSIIEIEDAELDEDLDEDSDDE